jgi:hypothetical protein
MESRMRLPEFLRQHTVKRWLRERTQPLWSPSCTSK